MKILLNVITLLSAVFAQAELPMEGNYYCVGQRAVNMTPTTADDLNLRFWNSQHGNPIASITTTATSVRVESLFGGKNTEYLQPIQQRACESNFGDYRVQGCALAFLPAVKDAKNLFVSPGLQSVHGIKISGNYKAYPNYTSVALEISFRKNQSHWERVYTCILK